MTTGDVGSEGAGAIAQALETNQSLLQLSLGENHIGYEGATAFAKALETNTTLQTL